MVISDHTVLTLPPLGGFNGGGFGGGHGGGFGGRGGHDDWGKRPGEDLDGPPSRMRKMDTRSATPDISPLFYNVALI